MDLALYAPGLGYYVRERDPFGTAGDFYTAEHIQPVFGILIAQFVESIQRDMNHPAAFRVVELGAGRGDMAPALAPFHYLPVEVCNGEFPARVTGVVLANEFFDALPVHLAVRRGVVFRDVMVTCSEGRFRFMDGEPAGGERLAYLDRYYPHAEDGALIEIHLRGIEWIRRIADTLDGWLLLIDYGYTAQEWIRYSQGTLMSYHRHTASDDVLADPGERDITAHVPFTPFVQEAAAAGLTMRGFETLASFLLRTGEPDQFAAALQAATEQESLRRRMQLKTLLYGMGETFRVLLANRSTQ